MSRGPVHFRQADLARALKAAKAAGLTVRSITVEDGRLELQLVTTDCDKEAQPAALDKWMAQHAS
jgi:hypothetical protein